MTLAQLKAAIQAEGRRRAAEAGSPSAEADPDPEPPPGAPPVPPRAATGPGVPRGSGYSRFEALEGRELVAACYTELLGRAPDAAGMDHYLGLLARGEEKALVVGSLAYSPEGRARRARVAGLFPRFAIAAAQRVPLVGWLVAWIAALATLPRRQREARAFERRVRERLDSIDRY